MDIKKESTSGGRYSVQFFNTADHAGYYDWNAFLYRCGYMGDCCSGM